MSPDDLTGLLARGELFPRLQSALALASQHNQALTLAYFDLDHLHDVNSTYGHLAGDSYIQKIGDALKEAFPAAEAFAARIGGDEFVAVAPAQSLEQVKGNAEQARRRVAESPLVLERGGNREEVQVTVSAGLAHLPAGETSVTSDELVRRAYETCLRAKESGGNSVLVYAEAEERDALTGLVKRAGLLARLDQACRAAEARRSTVALITFDVDEFDALNRQFGHYTGDEVLRRVAQALHSNLKESGVVGRYAGDEFMVILPGSHSETAFILAEEVRKVVEDTPIPIQAGEMKSQLAVRISGGVAEFPSDGSDWREIMRKADEALYRAKQQGRNRICLSLSSQMVTKTSHFTQTQLEKLSELARRTAKSEAYLLREGLDDLLRKYDK